MVLPDTTATASPTPTPTVTVTATPAPAPTVTVTPAPSIASGFTVIGPQVTTAGTTATFTVTALDQSGNQNADYQGTVQFRSSDPKAVLPSSAQVIGGVATFSVRFYMGGPQTLTVMDTQNNNALGTSVPTAVAGPSISTGPLHTCATTSTGLGLYCWGDNSSTESDLTQPAGTPFYVPRAVALSSFTHAAATDFDPLPTT